MAARRESYPEEVGIFNSNEVNDTQYMGYYPEKMNCIR